MINAVLAAYKRVIVFSKERGLSTFLLMDKS
jgi:hypothetical protein